MVFRYTDKKHVFFKAIAFLWGYCGKLMHVVVLPLDVIVVHVNVAQLASSLPLDMPIDCAPKETSNSSIHLYKSSPTS